MKRRLLTLSCSLLCIINICKAQTSQAEDLLLSEYQSQKVDHTFKTNRVVLAQSIEQSPKGILDFRISHRFGPINQGLYDLFGLDAAVMRLGFDYGLTDKIMLTAGRSTLDKEIDGGIKFRLLTQTKNNRMPISLSYFGNIQLNTMRPRIDPQYTYYFSNRLAYTNQLLIARKFNERLSLQISPTHIHYNLVEKTSESNDLIAIGLSGRYKFFKKVSLNAEYFYQFPSLQQQNTKNSLSIGMDIETGGHVFQLFLTNGISFTERAFIGKNPLNWQEGGIHFGFTISRVFQLGKS